VSRITSVQYDLMTKRPENISLVMANGMMETVASKSLLTLFKTGSKVKAQFSFDADRPNDHPLTYVFLVINGDITGSYQLKPPITDVSAVRALNVEWEI
jgi:hypothetical protein